MARPNSMIPGAQPGCASNATRPLRWRQAVEREDGAGDRECLAQRVRELADLDRLMRQPGGLAEVPEPVPLCRAGRTTTTSEERTPRG